MRILHSADWQIGARFRQFGEHAPRLRAARLRTFQRVLQLAVARQVDALLIAGDLFEDHQIEAATIEQVYDLLARHSGVPIYILPGNHDSVGGLSTIWARRPFSTPLPHVRIILEAAALELPGGWLVANPLTQKRSSVDPSLALVAMANALPAGTIKIGMTHGSLAVPTKHDPDDFPISLEAATRAGLDFLAIGHWHSAQTLDGGRLHMAGTPETTSFDEQTSGRVHEIEISAPAAAPRITSLAVGELKWRRFHWEPGGTAEARSRLEAELAECEVDAAQTVARITLEGLAAPSVVAIEMAWLRERTAALAYAEIRDETAPDFSAAELTELEREHPLLAQVLEDLHSLQVPTADDEQALTRGELAELESSLGGTPGEMDSLVATARRMLMRDLREVQSGC